MKIIPAIDSGAFKTTILIPYIDLFCRYVFYQFFQLLREYEKGRCQYFRVRGWSRHKNTIRKRLRGIENYYFDTQHFDTQYVLLL